MDKEVENGWALTLTIALVRHIKYTIVVTLGVDDKLLINDKGERYTKICVTHD